MIADKISKFVWIVVILAGVFSTAASGAEEMRTSPLEPQLLAFCGIRAVQEREPNLTGLDVQIAAVCRSMTYLDGLPQGDYRFDMSHRCLEGSGVTFADGSNGYYGLSSHATAIGGILVGLDPIGSHSERGGFFYKGICPDASVEVYEFWRFVSLTIFGGRDFSADILTLSLGDLYEDWWTRGIDRLAAEKGVLVVASAGNGAESGDSVLYPAAGANVLAVGVLDAEIGPDGQPMLGSFSLPRKGNSSYGPTADRRCKPDLTAPGRGLVPTAQGLAEYDIAGDYTSLAAPTVSGTAALLVQKARTTPALDRHMGILGRNCVLKAILMSSAQKLPFWNKGLPGPEDDTQTPLDFQQGAGLLDAEEAVRLLTEGNRPETGSEKGWDHLILSADRPAALYPFITRLPMGQYLTATIAWNRHYEDRYPFHLLEDTNSDLRLELWAIDPNTAERILVDISDSPVDTVEHIHIPLLPDSAEYELMVRINNPEVLSSGRREHVGLAWSVGEDRSVVNPWWYDLNEDGRIDETDQMVFTIFDRDQTELIDQPLIRETLKLSQERIDLLTLQWDQWKPYLSRWHSPSG